MSFSRRRFLGALVSSTPMILAGARLDTSLGQTRVGPPVLTNYNSTGRALVVEGKTLLVALAFPTEMERVAGSLPVQIQPESAGGSFLTEPQELYFYYTRGRRVFHTILSAPLDSVEGSYTLRITAKAVGGPVGEWTFPYLIARGVYRSTVLTLDENFSSPPPEIAARMRRDFETNVEIVKKRTEPRWTEPFVRPVRFGDNDNFGVRRTVNRTKRYRHIGLDFRAPMGTPVQAMNDGTVVLSSEQWTPGQIITLDHGGSVFSKYIHLSERHVRVGQTVTRGQVIGLSGNSGGQRTAPHLHLDTFVNRTAVDPKDFMRTAAQLVSA